MRLMMPLINYWKLKRQERLRLSNAILKKTENYPNLTLDKMLVFLGDHMDANCLSALSASLSSEESQVLCYMIDGVVVATLTVPAGLSLIYTTKIHSGSKTLNLFGLKHFSRCGLD